MSEKTPNEKPDAAEFGLLRAFLAQQGFTQQWIQDNTGSPNELTRAEITSQLKEAMKILPKEGA